jgi:hypothetical protein
MGIWFRYEMKLLVIFIVFIERWDTVILLWLLWYFSWISDRWHDGFFVLVNNWIRVGYFKSRWHIYREEVFFGKINYLMFYENIGIDNILKL